MYVMFLDESGTHNLSSSDPDYPVFVLGGVIVKKSYAENEMEQRIRQFKIDLFGRDNIILHTSDINRNRNGFERLQEGEFRAKFYVELNRLMRSLEYRVLACVIMKEDHLKEYGLAALDPYMLSLDILVERFCFEIGNRPTSGSIIAEKRNPELDHELEIAWLNLRIKGTHYVAAREIERKIIGLTTRPKKDNLAGLQLADLVVNPIGRHVLGRRTHEDFEIVKSKLRQNSNGVYEGIGLVILPGK
ncbi:DUF3800 domain-containing protein [Nitrospira sp. Nam74]